MSLYLTTKPTSSIEVRGRKVIFTHMSAATQVGVCVDVLALFRDIVDWAYNRTEDHAERVAIGELSKAIPTNYIGWLNALVQKKSGIKVCYPTLIMSGDIMFYDAADANGYVKAYVSVKDALEAIGEYIGIYSSLPGMRVTLSNDDDVCVLEKQVLLEEEKDRWDTISSHFIPKEEAEDVRNAYHDFYLLMNGIESIIGKEGN